MQLIEEMVLGEPSEPPNDALNIVSHMGCVLMVRCLMHAFRSVRQAMLRQAQLNKNKYMINVCT